MKKFISILMAAVIAAGMLTCLGGCGDKKTDENASGSGVQELRVGLECAYAPFNWTQTDDSNNAVKIEGTNEYANGYDVQIAKKIADSLGRKLVICKMTWDGLIPGVQSGAIDMIIAGMSPTEERKQSIDFTDAYYTSNLVVVVRKDGKFADAKSLSDLSGARIVGQQGTFHEQVITQIPDVIKETSMKDFGTMIVALRASSIDGYIAEKPGAIANCAANSDFTYVDLKNNDTGFTVEDSDVQIAVGIKKGNELTAQVNTILAGISQEERDNIMNDAISNQP